ncbi:MAG TPA: mechanosensitive ion channel domain-containing protein [Acidobacteriota bacterium]|nr:mechanosensitive ion channel domain-containing protein [Acidobacteriota bacterium]
MEIAVLIVNCVITLGLIFVYMLLYQWILRRVTNRFYKQPKHAHLVRQLLRLILAIFFTLVILVVWFGSRIENVWITITSIIGVVAVGFFAVWSVLSNIVCGVILLLIRNIEVGDHVTLLEPKCSGVIEEIGLFYIVLTSKQGTLHIPNNVFIQKIVFKRR